MGLILGVRYFFLHTQWIGAFRTPSLLWGHFSWLRRGDKIDICGFGKKGLCFDLNALEGESYGYNELTLTSSFLLTVRSLGGSITMTERLTWTIGTPAIPRK